MSHDHEKGTHYFSDMKAYIKAVRAAVKSGRGFRLAWDGDSSPATFEKWSEVVWAVLNGDKLTYVVIEELARCVETVGRAAPALRKLYNEGRKFGAIIHAVTQRPQEIPKTVYDQSNDFWIGQQKSTNIKKFSELLDVHYDDIKHLLPLQFFHFDEGSGKPAQKLSLKYVQ